MQGWYKRLEDDKMKYKWSSTDVKPRTVINSDHVIYWLVNLSTNTP